MAASEYVVKIDASEVYKAIASSGVRSFIAKKHDDKTATIVIFDDIGASFFGDGITGKSINAELKAFGEVDTITVRINSPGGSVFDGLAIYNLLAQHPARIVVEIDGLAASAASLIAMAGDEIRMAENALMMTHPASTVVAGNSKDMRETANILDKIGESLIGIYAARTGMSRDDVAEQLVNVATDTWLTASEALDIGLITEITPDKAIAAHAVAHLRGIGEAVISPDSDAISAGYTRASKNVLDEFGIDPDDFPYVSFVTEDTPVHTERKQQPTTQGTQMEWFKALGYDGEAQALAAFAEIKTFQNGVVSATGASSPADAVTRLTEMTAKIEGLEAAATAALVQAEAVKVDAEIATLTAEMRLAPAQADLYRSLNASQREAFSATLTPVNTANSAPKPPAEGADPVLNETQEKMIKDNGLDRAGFIAQLKIEQEGGAQ